MASFRWRIPFLLGLFLGLFGLYLRRKLEESPVFENHVATQQKEIAFLTFTNHQILLQRYICMFCSCCILQCYELYGNCILPTYLEQVIKLDATTTSINYLCR